MGMSLPLMDTLQPANNRTKCPTATNASIATVVVANGFMDLPPCDEARLFGGVEHLQELTPLDKRFARCHRSSILAAREAAILAAREATEGGPNLWGRQFLRCGGCQNGNGVQALVVSAGHRAMMKTSLLKLLRRAYRG